MNLFGFKCKTLDGVCIIILLLMLACAALFFWVGVFCQQSEFLIELSGVVLGLFLAFLSLFILFRLPTPLNRCVCRRYKINLDRNVSVRMISYWLMLFLWFWLVVCICINTAVDEPNIWDVTSGLFWLAFAFWAWFSFLFSRRAVSNVRIFFFVLALDSLTEIFFNWLHPSEDVVVMILDLLLLAPICLCLGMTFREDVKNSFSNQRMMSSWGVVFGVAVYCVSFLSYLYGS